MSRLQTAKGVCISKLRPIRSEILLKILQKYYGYAARQGKGDHIVLHDQKGHSTIVQSGKELRHHIVRLILKQTELKWEDIEKYI